MTKSLTVSTLILFCIALVETAILSNISFLPVVPDLLLICTLYFGLLNGRGYGEFSGFVSGLFLDFLSGAPFGFNCLFRAIVGYFAGWVGLTVNYNGIFMPFCIGFFGMLLKAFTIWVISLFYPSIIINYHIFSITFLCELILNTVLTPFMFKFLSSFRKMIAIYPEDRI